MERGNILIKRNKITISYIKEYLQRIGSSSILLLRISYLDIKSYKYEQIIQSIMN